ncbi:hypothetical protein BOX15_Mlig018636g1 [Macrostomum lignano]|uniref:Uncharacterized protein n=1 Tax=Macrostomum lignano TaxID=282301 RepID=A0A267FDH3_9PLAT|nr:hypothetical protein BOX15_Mlig034051g2 [Macrostomum lignano]PAA71806.1 hypothetical protein BOX15_Mlig018636g1 [Macrostomum lignano]
MDRLIPISIERAIKFVDKAKAKGENGASRATRLLRAMGLPPTAVSLRSKEALLRKVERERGNAVVLRRRHYEEVAAGKPSSYENYVKGDLDVPNVLLQELQQLSVTPKRDITGGEQQQSDDSDANNTDDAQAAATPGRGAAAAASATSAVSGMSIDEQLGVEAALKEIIDELRAQLLEKQQEQQRLERRLARRLPRKVVSHQLRRLHDRLDKAHDAALQQKRTILRLKEANRTLRSRLQQLNGNNAGLQKSKKQVGELRSHIHELHSSLDQASELLEEAAQGRGLATMEKRPSQGGMQFTNRVIETCVNLVLDCHVPVRYVSPCIRCVLSGLTSFDASPTVLPLPSKSLVASTAFSVGNCLAKASGLDSVLAASLANRPLTLMTDGTSKKGRHYAEYQIDTGLGANRTVCLSLREVEGGTAEVYFREFDASMDDLVYNYCALTLGDRSDEERQEMKSNVVMTLKFLMTDRHVVNKSLHLLLNDMRSQLADRQGAPAPPRMVALFCGMHVIVNLAGVADKALLDFEKCASLGPLGAAACAGFYPSKAESGAQRLIRTVCKAFHHLGSEQCGVFTSLESYLAIHDKPAFRMEDFRGNRLYVIFPNGGFLYRQKDVLSAFLSASEGKNRLLLAVEADLASGVLLAGCRALGLLDLLLIRPLWTLLRDSGVTLIDMNRHYETAHRWLQSVASADSVAPSVELQGPFPELAHSVLRDADAQTSWEALTTAEASLEENSLVGQALQVICAHMLVLLQREVADHLDGGRLRSLSTEDSAAAAQAPKDNVAGERMFAALDYSVQGKPHMRLLARESTVLFGQNRTADWLREKSEGEKDLILTRARALAPLMESRAARLATLNRERRQELMRRKLDERQRKKQQRAANLRNTISGVESYGGMWRTAEGMASNLASLQPAEQETAIKAQLRLHKCTKMVLPKDKSHLLNFSARGVRFSLAQLHQNLEEVLEILAQQTEAAQQSATPHSGSTLASEVREERVKSAVQAILSKASGPPAASTVKKAKPPMPVCSAVEDVAVAKDTSVKEAEAEGVVAAPGLQLRSPVMRPARMPSQTARNQACRVSMPVSASKCSSRTSTKTPT